MLGKELCAAVDEMFSKYNKRDSPGFAVGLIRDGEFLFTSYRVCPDENGLRLTNSNHHNTAVDFLYKPTIRDSFIAQYPPYVNWYCISFQRDSTGHVVSFTYRDDEGSGRENLVFFRLA